MDAKGWMTFNALNKKFHSGSDELLKYLPEEEQAELKKHDVKSAGDLSWLVIDPVKGLRRIHYSWIQPVIEAFPSDLQPFVFSALGPKTRERLAQLMKKAPVPVKLSRPVRYYFARELYDRITDESICPLPFVPASELSPLLEMRTGELVGLIDMLGIHDLAAEFRHIIDRKQLDSVFKILSPKKKEYLKQVMHQKHKGMGSPLPLASVNGSGDKLRRLLHHKGLIRLGAALHGADPNFLWHLTHSLDCGRAQVLKKYIAKEENDETVSSMASQVLSTLRFLKQ